MSTKSLGTLIGLLAMSLLAAVLVIGVLLGRGGDDTPSDAPGTAASTSPTTASPGTSHPPGSAITSAPSTAADSAALLADADTDAIYPAPIPEALDAFGGFTVKSSWEGTMAVSPGAEWQPLGGPFGQAFPASQNKCGLAMNLTTFSADGTGLEVALLDTLGNPVETETVDEGWSWSTDCAIPAVRVVGGPPTTVSYTVHTYLNGNYGAAAPAAVSASVPTLVRCLGTLGPAEGVYSDGVQRRAPECEGSPEKERAVRAEGMCGGLYPPEGTDPDEYLATCNRPMPSRPG